MEIIFINAMSSVNKSRSWSPERDQKVKRKKERNSERSRCSSRSTCSRKRKYRSRSRDRFDRSLNNQEEDQHSSVSRYDDYSSDSDADYRRSRRRDKKHSSRKRKKKHLKREEKLRRTSRKRDSNRKSRRGKYRSDDDESGCPSRDVGREDSELNRPNKKTNPNSNPTSESPVKEAKISGDPVSCKAKRMVPMTREEYEKQQNIVREIFDPESGRYRLVRGTGEIIERIVSRSDHERINQIATRGDGMSFSRNVGNAAAMQTRRPK